jgi:multiple sugar transport system permease protein
MRGGLATSARERLWMAWIAPALLVIVWGVPVVIVIVGSFLRLDISEPNDFFSFDSLAHYRESVVSSAFWLAVWRTIKLTFLVVLVSVLCGGIIGFSLLRVHQAIARLALKLIILPLFLPPLVSALIWYFQFNPQYGPIGYTIHSFTGKAILDPQTAFYAIVGIECWRLTPFFTLIVFICGRSLEPSLTDTLVIYKCRYSWSVCALIIRRFYPVWTVALFLGFALVAKSFESVFVTTGGGPGELTETLPMLIHRTAFQRFQLGLAACQSVVYDVILVLSLGWMWKRVRRNDN